MRVWFLALITSLVTLSSSADQIAIKGTGKTLSAIAPQGWVRQTPGTGNSRIRFSSPQGTPYAECAVIALEMPSLRGQPQSYFDQVMLEAPDAREIEQSLSMNFGNVRVLGIGRSLLSGHPAHIASVTYNMGTPNGPMWVRGVHITTGTTPGLAWTVSCGASGNSPQEAERSYRHWQSEIAKFPTYIRIHP